VKAENVSVQLPNNIPVGNVWYVTSPTNREGIKQVIIKLHEVKSPLPYWIKQEMLLYSTKIHI